MKQKCQRILFALVFYFLPSLFVLAHSNTLVGSIPGQFNVGSTGAAEYSIPIELPPGTAGVQPQLSLNYNSQGGNGLLGVGWSLGGLSVMHRCPTTKAKDGFIDGVDFDSNDRFCLDGQPLVAVSGVYGAANTEYKTELDGFSKIVSYGSTGNGPQYFKVWTKSGDVMEYGNTNDSLINPPLADGTVQSDALCWLLNKVSDSVGNYMTFTYFEDEATGENYPLSINYTGNSTQSLTPYNSVEFEYEARGDDNQKYLSGNLLTSTKRLSLIGINDDQNLVSSYNINYELSDETNKSRIISIDKCLLNNSCVLDTEFHYEDLQPGWLANVGYEPPVQFATQSSSDNNYSDYGSRYIDLNGDGLVDLVRSVQFKSGTWSKTAWINTGSGWVVDANYQPPVQFVTQSSTGNIFSDYGARFVDLNGDGLVDLVRSIQFKSGTIVKTAYINTGSGWQLDTSYGPPIPIVRQEENNNIYSDYGARFVDLNGDGLVDLVRSIQFKSGTIVKTAYINIGSGWQVDTDFEPPLSIVTQASTNNSFSDYGARFIDLNGDGLVDFTRSIRFKTGTIVKAAYLNTGSGWLANVGYEPPVQFATQSSSDNNYSDYGSRYIDLNGDGLVDLVRSIQFKSGTWSKTAWINTGSGWVVDANYQPPVQFVTQSSSGNIFSDYGARFVDLNGDGLVDLVRSIQFKSGTIVKTAYINTGSGWQVDTDFKPSLSIVTQASTNNIYSDYGARFIDLNGDGLVDFTRTIRFKTGTIVKAAYLNSYSKKPDIMTKVTNGLGISIDIDYKSLTDTIIYSNGVVSKRIYKNNDSSVECDDDYVSVSCSIVNVQSPMYVVSQSRTDNGVGSQNTLSYKYEGAKAHLHGRGFLGFASRTVTDATTGTTVETNFRQDFPFIGLVSSSETWFGSTLVSSETNTHAQTTTGTSTTTGSTDPMFIYTDQSVAVSNDLDTGALITTTTTASTYDAYGNPTLITATTNDVGQPSFVTTTNNTYTNDTTKWHLGRLTNASVTKSLGGVASPMRSSSFEYHATTGFLTKEIIEPGSSMELMKTYTHDGYGNRLSVTTSGTGITSRTTSTTYDSKGRFALTATNALSHSETREYNDTLNKGWGQVTKLTGPNGLSTIWEYDTLGRKIKETRADGTISTMTYTFCDGSNPCPTLANSQTPAYFMTSVSTGAPTSITYYDAVNRAVLSESESFDGTTVSAQTEYDSRARVKRTSLPYFGSTPNYWTVNTYDTLDRLTQENSPSNGITGYNYDGLKTTVTNDLNQDMIEVKNSRGQTLWSDDEDGNRVSFTYDAAGNLTEVSDGTHVTTNTYDLRGFKTSMDDPDMGQWSYTYNVLGELISQTNANSQTTTMTYDLLGRLITRVEPEGTTTWNYDTATKGVGKLASVTQYGGYTSTQSYDSLGRPSSTSSTINAVVHTTSSTYDSVGRVDEITYPTGFKVKQQYTTLGYLEKVVNATTPTTEYWTALATDEFGNVTLSNVGGILTAKDYEDNTGRLFDVNSGLGIVQDLRYDYDTIGNLTQRKDDLQNKTENFLYDDLNRLTSAEVVGVGTKTFAYDAMGNITSKSDVGSYLYGNNAGPHAVTSTTGSINATYVYDNNGNMQTGNGRTISWSSYNKPTQITQGNNIVSFSYGPDRARYQQVATDNSTVKTTTYIGSLYEKVQTGSNIENKHYIRAGGQVIAIHNTYNNQSDATQFLHRDHLGSVDVITDENQLVTERLSFDAFGQRRQATWQDAISQITSTVTRGFTGHEQLDSVGLIHMNGRVYDPQLGRFLSADPFVQQPKNLQSLNRYTYVQNNPLSYTDPSGFFFKKLKKAFKKVVKSISRVVSKALSNQYVRLGLAIAAGFGVGSAILQAYNTAALAGGALAGSTLAISYSAATAIAGAAGGVVGGLIASGGDFGAAAVGGLTGGAAGFIGASSAFGRVGNVTAGRVVAHGVVGGAASEAQGGKFSSGFISSAFTKSVSNRVQAISNGNPLAGGIAAAVVGGTASRLTGGKFQNAALTSGFQYLFNHEFSRPHTHDTADQSSAFSYHAEADGGIWKVRKVGVCAVTAVCDSSQLYDTADPETLKYLYALELEVLRDVRKASLTYNVFKKTPISRFINKGIDTRFKQLEYLVYGKVAEPTIITR